MNPILFDASELTFDSNGLGVLSDAISCTVTEERNGAFELTLEYPISGIHYEEISNRRIIYCKPNPYASPQPFRIYRMTKPLSGRVTVYAEHISYDLSGIPVSPFTAGSASAAMLQIENSAAVDSNFTFWTDKETAATMTVEVPSSTRSILGGNAGSVLDVYGGEYEWDGWTVRLWSARGSDNGVIIRYGKNLTDLEQDENISNVATGVYPYWKDSDGNLVELPEKIVNAPGTYNFTRIIPLDLSSDFEEQPTVEQLRERAEKYVDDNDIGIPTVSISVAFQSLDQTEEYKDLALLERVGLCDTVTVQYETLGVSAKAKCVKTEYDALLDRYTSIELGDARTNIADTIYDQGKEIQELPESSAFLNAVNNATNWITNGRGYMVAVKDENGNWMEMVSLDTPDIETAQNVWRWNNGGFGHSSSGYNGPYDTAITQDGAIVANFITAGTMSANLVRAGVLASQNNRLKFDLDNALLQTFDANGNITMEFTERGLSFVHGGVTLLEISSDDAGNVNFAWRGPTGKLAFRRESTAYPIEEFLTIYPYDMGPDQEGGVHTFHLYPYSIDMNGENVGSSSSKGSISNVNSISVWGEITAVRNNRNVYAVLSAPSGEDRVLQIGVESGSNLTLHGTAQTFYIAITSSDEMLKDNIADTAEQALPQVNAIRHRSFTWKEGAIKEKLGYVAQELERINARWVDHVPQPDGEDMVQPRIDRIVPYLSKAIQELSARIDELERKVNADGN